MSGEGKRQAQRCRELRAKSTGPQQCYGNIAALSGIAFTAWPFRAGPRYVRNSASNAGKSSPLCLRSRRSACIVWKSPPGARPSPRSIRPGYSASSVPNCSATTSGAWFGSITPPLPTRIRFVAAATCPISTGVAGACQPLNRVMLRQPIALVPQSFNMLCKVDRSRHRGANLFPRAHTHKIQNGNGQRVVPAGFEGVLHVHLDVFPISNR